MWTRLQTGCSADTAKAEGKKVEMQSFWWDHPLLEQVLGHSPIGVVARVWRPTNCAGPMLPRKSLNCASDARQTPP